jgi:predicted permease
MREQLLSIASTVIGVFLVMAMGGIARHLKWFTSDVDRSLAGFTANVLMPSLFFHRIMTDRDLSMHLDAWLPVLYGFLCTSAGFLVASVAASLFGRWFGLTNESQRRTFSLCAGIDNYGYLPLPLAEAFFPACVVTLMIHNVGVDIALWSVGLFIISGASIRQSWRRIVFSPPLMSVAVAVFIRQLGIETWVPAPLLQMCDQLGRCSVPMSLVLGGAIIYDYAGQFDPSRAWKPLLLAILIRIILLPIAILVVAKWTTEHVELKQVLMLQASMPAATFPIVMTRLYNQDVETAWIVVVGTSILGLVTIPLWMVIASQFLGTH